MSVTAPVASSPPRYLRRRVIATTGAALLFLAAAAAVWRPDYLPAALLRRADPAASTASPVVARFYSFDLVREYPHDPDAFTQVRTLLPDLIRSRPGLFLTNFPNFMISFDRVSCMEAMTLFSSPPAFTRG
jgi:hypothetical protein